MTYTQRPDERTSQAQIEKNENFTKNLKRGAKTALGLGASAAGLGIGAKILPLINQYVPTDLAIKGISKLSPEIGKFLQKGMSQGLDIKDGLQFLKDGFEKQSESKKAPDQRSIIEQYSPELNQFIVGEMQKGRSPLEAGALAQLNKNFAPIIKKMSADHKAPFSSILESVFPQGKAASQPQTQAAAQTQPSQPAQPNQSNPADGKTALLKAMNDMKQMMQKLQRP